MTDIGGFTPQQAREVWDTTKLLRSSGILRNLSNLSLPDDPGLACVLVKNESGEEIPAFACMQITGTEVVDDRTFLKVTKPDSTDGKYIFNHDRVIDASGLGMALPWGVVRMIGDAPSEPKEYGPQVDSWEVSELAGGPFTVYGADAYKDGIVKGRITGSGGGAMQVIEFTLLSQEDYPSTNEYEDEDLCENKVIAEAPYYGEVVKVACGSSRPVQGEDCEGIVELADDLGILADRDVKQIGGQKGIAVLIKNADPSDYDPECYWCIVYVDFHREIQVVTDIVFQSDRIVIERKLVKVWDDCKLEDEEILGITCESTDYSI